MTRKREVNPGSRPPTRPDFRQPIYLQAMEILVVEVHKFLGVLLDQELHWKQHVNYMQQKG